MNKKEPKQLKMGWKVREIIGQVIINKRLFDRYGWNRISFMPWLKQIIKQMRHSL
ncbi:MAG: hypothetical protein R3321_10020 [Nitrososphaeraceae archaeon]|nr:hypothetical protein [Nitrososphaeraceae archaeon]